MTDTEKKKKGTFSWLKVMICTVLAFFTFVFLYAWHSQHAYAHQALCSSMHAGDSVKDSTEWNIQGNSTIEKLTITITRSYSLDHYNPLTRDSDIALSMAGKYIQDIVSSKAVHTSFSSENTDTSHNVIVTIEIDPSKLTSPDYEYLNANGFIRIGTVDYDKDTVQELSTVLEADGYSCTYQ